MAKITKTEEQLTKELEVAMSKLYKTLPGTQEEKIQILRTKFENEIQQLIQPNQTEKEEASEEMKAILDLLRQLRPHQEIAEQYGKSQSAIISQIAKKNGIYSPKAVRQLLKTPEVAEMTNQDLAEKTGAYPDAIERIRKEIEKEEQERESKKQSKKKEKEEPSEDMKAILDLLRQLRPHAEIAEKYGKSHGYISAIAKNNGISSPKAVRELLKTPEAAEMTNKDLAEKTGAYPDAIERIRKEIEQEKQERESKKQEEKAKKDEERAERTKTKKQSKKKEKPEPSEEMKAIIDLLRQLKPHKEIAEQYDKSQPAIISQIAKKNGIWSPKAVRELIKTPEAAKMTNQDLAEKTGAYPDAIERIRKEIEQEKQERESKKQEEKAKKAEERAKRIKRQPKKKEKPEPSEEMKAIIDLLRQLKPHAEIAEQYSKTSRWIGIIAQQNGIYSPKAVRELLRTPEAAKMTNEDLAEKTGAYPDAIERIIQEIEKQEKAAGILQIKKSVTNIQEPKAEGKIERKEKRAEKTVTRETTQPQARNNTSRANSKADKPSSGLDINAFIRMAKEVEDIKAIAKRLNTTTGIVNSYLTQYGFWTRNRIVSALEKMPNEEIAKKGKVSIEAVQRIRMQEQAKAEKRSSNFARNDRLELQRSEARKKEGEKREFFAKAKNYRNIREWEGRTGVSAFEIVLELRRLKNAGVASKAQLDLLEEWEQQNIVRTSPQNRQVSFKIALRNYRDAVRNINIYSTKIAKSMVEHNAQKLLALYEDLLTPLHYTYLCHGYIKIEEELKAIELGREKLDLRELTLLSLRQKIDTIQEKETERKEPEAPESGAGGER